MCMQPSAVRPYQRWHWAGDEIVQRPIIPASRKVPGTTKAKYDIDIREYLSIGTNAVVRELLEKTIQELPVEDRFRFLFSSSAGTFDFRARIVTTSLNSLKYIETKRSFDHWQFPEETVARKGGDCEDLAFLLAALLAASGISQDCIRVALGRLVDHAARGGPRSWDHAWVVYQNEAGAWKILEPLAHLKSTPAKSGKRSAPDPDLDIEYIPNYVFNQNHLWRVKNPDRETARPFHDYLKRRGRFWGKFKPAFAMSVHNDIFDHALKGMGFLDLLAVKSASLAVDADVLRYDPRDHFDFAYIPEGWERVKSNLSTGSITDFGHAAHAIADFYAHSLYAHFVKPDASGKLPIYDPASPIPPKVLNYDFLAGTPLPDCAWSENKALEYWQGKLISGQWWRAYTTYPSELKSDKELLPRRCLPDHDVLAVDSPSQKHPDGYFQGAAYSAQFDLRRQAAIDHIASVYSNWKKQ